MKKFIIAFLIVLMPCLVSAKPFLICDPQANVVTYNVFLDDSQIATSDAVLDVDSGLYYLYFNLATLALADGDYIATATAENMWGESGLSNPYPFTKVVPSNPPNLRVSSGL